jgi:hypothetical protein
LAKRLIFFMSAAMAAVTYRVSVWRRFSALLDPL